MTINETKIQVSGSPLFCFSHLRWDSVFQRPHHLMSRYAEKSTVFFIEEPVRGDGKPRCDLSEPLNNLVRCVPVLPGDVHENSVGELMRGLVTQLVGDLPSRGEFIEWYYTPMMYGWLEQRGSVTVYDCMDELKNFKDPPKGLVDREKELLSKADLVFTGGRSIYLSKKDLHRNVYEFPSSIDAVHFGTARYHQEQPSDQAQIPSPRIGYAGVIDERIDLSLIATVAERTPEWSYVMIGPTAKIEASSLPVRPNIYYLGLKDYRELPAYMSGWDVGMMPFAINDATKYISPTKTPEYLAAGLPVVSTPITDVVTPYENLGLVEIAASAADFRAKLSTVISSPRDELIAKADKFLQGKSWDRTMDQMLALVKQASSARAMSASQNSIG